MQDGLAAFAGISTAIEDMFSARDKTVKRLVWRDPCQSIWGVKAVGKMT
jgi:hypothetical protein